MGCGMRKYPLSAATPTPTPPMALLPLVMVHNPIIASFQLPKVHHEGKLSSLLAWGTLPPAPFPFLSPGPSIPIHSTTPPSRCINTINVAFGSAISAKALCSRYGLGYSRQLTTKTNATRTWSLVVFAYGRWRR